MTQERTAARPQPIKLNYRSVQQVMVEPDDRDRFLVTAREVALACKRVQDEKEWREDFDQLLIVLVEWCRQRAHRVAACYVDIGDGCLNILIGTQGVSYAIDFEDEVTDLDLDLRRRFPWLVADVMQVPASSAEAHLSFEKAIVVHGDGRRTPPEGQS